MPGKIKSKGKSVRREIAGGPDESLLLELAITPTSGRRKKSSSQDNQVLFSRPSSMTSNEDSDHENARGEKPAAHQEDSAPSGLEHDPTRLYLHELGYKPLLTAEDELAVARRIKQETLPPVPK